VPSGGVSSWPDWRASLIGGRGFVPTPLAQKKCLFNTTTHYFVPSSFSVPCSLVQQAPALLLMRVLCCCVASCCVLLSVAQLCCAVMRYAMSCFVFWCSAVLSCAVSCCVSFALAYASKQHACKLYNYNHHALQDLSHTRPWTIQFHTIKCHLVPFLQTLQNANRHVLFSAIQPVDRVSSTRERERYRDSP
jgi:hypothetical protein